MKMGQQIIFRFNFRFSWSIHLLLCTIKIVFHYCLTSAFENFEKFWHFEKNGPKLQEIYKINVFWVKQWGYGWNKPIFHIAVGCCPVPPLGETLINRSGIEIAVSHCPIKNVIYPALMYQSRTFVLHSISIICEKSFKLRLI